MERPIVRIVVVCLWLLAGLPDARAGQMGVVLNGHAIHLEKSPKEKNELNYGLGLQYDSTMEKREWLWFAFGSGFRDSREDLSYNLGAGIRHRSLLDRGRDLHLDLGGAALVMTRESYRGGEPFPALLPVASFGNRKVSLNVTYVPEVDRRIIPLLFFQVVFFPTPSE